MLTHSVGASCEVYKISVKTGKRILCAVAKNLVFDAGITALGRSGTLSCYHNTATSFIMVGSSAAANRDDSGAITFTQSGTTVTASASFFTAAHVGQTLKFGSGAGGFEQKIVSQTGTACVTDTSHTEGSPIVGSVHYTGRTGLVSPLYVHTAFETGGTQNQTTFPSTNIVRHKRSVYFGVKGSTYTVNEVGYSSTSTLSTGLGRIVLGSPVTVNTGEILAVTLTFDLTVSPSTPTAVGDVSTGSWDTSGTAMIESYTGFGTVTSSGGTTTGYFDGLNPFAKFIRSTFTQNSSISTSAKTVGAHGGNSGSWTNIANGVVRFTSGNFNFFYSTYYGVALGASGDGASINCPFTLKFTTPQTGSLGTIASGFDMRQTFTRVLTNP